MDKKVDTALHTDIQNEMVLSGIKDDLILSDQKEALAALALDRKFVESLISQKTLKEMQNLFSNRGVILSEEEIDSFIEMVRTSSSKQDLPDEFFEDAAAGVLNNQGMYKLVGAAADIINNKPENKSIADSVLWRV